MACSVDFFNNSLGILLTNLITQDYKRNLCFTNSIYYLYLSIR